MKTEKKNKNKPYNLMALITEMQNQAQQEVVKQPLENLSFIVNGN